MAGLGAKGGTAERVGAAIGGVIGNTRAGEAIRQGVAKAGETMRQAATAVGKEYQGAKAKVKSMFKEEETSDRFKNKLNMMREDRLVEFRKYGKADAALDAASFIPGPVGQGLQMAGMAMQFYPMIKMIGNATKSFMTLGSMVTKFGSIAGKVALIASNSLRACGLLPITNLTCSAGLRKVF